MSDGKLLAWAVCANISDHLRGGIDKERFYQGTRAFAPGTKVYLGEPYRGMGGEKLHVVGLKRRPRVFGNCVIHVALLDNLRLASLYSERLVDKLTRKDANLFDDKAEAEELLNYIKGARAYDLPDKLKPETREGPWGPYEKEIYRGRKA